MNNITNLRTRKNQITKSLKKLIVFFSNCKFSSALVNRRRMGGS